MKEKPDNSTVWNAAAIWALAFGAVSTACHVARYLAMAHLGEKMQVLSAGILWAAEFFGCLFLMKECLVRFSVKYPGAELQDSMKFGRRIALMSGLILASAEAISIMQMPDGEISAAFESIAADFSSRLSSEQRDEFLQMADKMPLVTFLSQWLYCFLYGSLLSSILSKFLYERRRINGQDDNDNVEDQ